MQTKDLELEKLVNEFEHVGITVIHTDKKDIDYMCTYGKQSLEQNIDTPDDCIYRIASISKIEVALAAMKLVEEGKLDLRADISKYLGYEFRNPYYPLIPITVEMLMTQTSSLDDGDDDGDVGYCGTLGILDKIKLRDLLFNKDFKYYFDGSFTTHAPGTYWHYSNLGCGVLACVVEKVAGELFTDYVKRVVFDPLGLDAGFRIDQIKNTNAIATLYDFNDKDHSFIKQRNYETYVKKAYKIDELGDNYRGVAGGLLIGGKDLSIIMRMLMNDGIYNGVRVFKEDTIKEMKKVHWHGISEDPQYRAKGLQLLLLDGYSKQTLMGHFGFAYGLRSFMLFNENNGYIFLCNGANYGNYAEHMTVFQEKVIKYLVGKFENHEE